MRSCYWRILAFGLVCRSIFGEGRAGFFTLDTTAHPKTLVILPAYNEAGNIAHTVGNICQQVRPIDVLVINDGSGDATRAEAEQAGAIVLDMPYNVGIGAAVQAGFKFAAQHGYTVVVRNDGDGQHDPADIVPLLHHLHSRDVDVVIGSRFLGEDGDYGTPLTRRIGILLIANLLTVIIGQKVTDPTSGFAAFNHRAIRLFAHAYPHDYPEPESIMILHRSGLRQLEVPAHFRAREHGQSTITPVRSVYYMIKVILAILITGIRRPPLADL